MCLFCDEEYLFEWQLVLMDGDDIVDFLQCHGEDVEGLDPDRDLDLLLEMIYSKYFRPDWIDFDDMHPNETVNEFMDHEE